MRANRARLFEGGLLNPAGGVLFLVLFEVLASCTGSRTNDASNWENSMAIQKEHMDLDSLYQHFMAAGVIDVEALRGGGVNSEGVFTIRIGALLVGESLEEERLAVELCDRTMDWLDGVAVEGVGAVEVRDALDRIAASGSIDVGCSFVGTALPENP